jgi:hypothetical protein
MSNACPIRAAPPDIRILGADGVMDSLSETCLLFHLAHRRITPCDILRLSVAFGEAPVSGAEILDEKHFLAIHDLDAGAAERFCCQA